MYHPLNLICRITPEWAKDIYRFAHTMIPMGWHLGPRYRKLVRLMNKTQWWHADHLRAFQEYKLRHLIHYCYERVPYYREVMRRSNLLPGDIRTLDDLPKLPLLTKKTVKEHYNDLKSLDFSGRGLHLAHSGGTSGDNLNLYLDQEAYLIERACYVRRYRWAGYREGERCVYFRGPLNMQWPDGSPRLWYYNLQRKWLEMETRDPSESRLRRIVNKMATFKPKVLSVFPSNLEVLGRYLLKHDIRLPSIRSVITSSETVLPWHRSLARRAFDCEIFDWYGQAEHVASAAQCPVGSYHINVEYQVLELIDEQDQPVSEGVGEIVGTGLDSFALPLIRYRMGDLASCTNKLCSCGRGLPVLESLQGRTWESILKPDGTKVSATTIHMALNPILDQGNLGQIQIRQTSLDRIEVLLVHQPDFSTVALEELINTLKAEIGDTVSIEHKFVDSISKTQAGKHQLFTREPALREPQLVQAGID